MKIVIIQALTKFGGWLSLLSHKIWQLIYRSGAENLSGASCLPGDKI
jgi:hypothetical protein